MVQLGLGGDVSIPQNMVVAKEIEMRGTFGAFFSRPWSLHSREGWRMKFVTDRPYADPDKAARTRLEIANTIDVVQDGKAYIELIANLQPAQQKAPPLLTGLLLGMTLPLTCG